MKMRKRPQNKHNKPRLETARAAIAATSLVVCLMLTVSGLSGGRLLSMGRGLAMLSAGIMQPEGGAQMLCERLSRIPAAQQGDNRSEPVFLTTYTPGGGMQTSGELSPLPKDISGVVPSEAGDGGKIVEIQMTTGSNFIQGVAIKNGSSRTVDISSQLKIKPDIKITDSVNPQVLIMHTHTTECYMSYYAGYYNKSDESRSKDHTRNVVAVGEAICAQLRAANIAAIHDVTVHDSPKYSGAYERSVQTVKKILEQYPSISVVIDIHRDAIYKSKTERYKPTITINGRKAAQMMIIASVGNSAAVPHPNWQQNLRFALRLQSALHTQYTGIMRPLYIVDSRYNQHLTNGSLLIEVGADSNTVSEAVYSGEILGKTLAQVLNTLKQ